MGKYCRLLAGFFFICKSPWRQWYHANTGVLYNYIEIGVIHNYNYKLSLRSFRCLATGVTTLSITVIILYKVGKNKIGL